jgi:hypothetical protein
MARNAHSGVRWPAKIISREPALTRLPSTQPRNPDPNSSVTACGIFTVRPRRVAARTMASARTWCEACSSEAKHQHLIGFFAWRHLD